jgi:pimeloyl-ACP methyl ester carboxylesterase
MPFYEKGPVRIYYEDVGSGFPLFLIPGGGMNATISKFAESARFNPLEEFKDQYRCITLDLRNAYDGQSSGPLEIDRPWDAHADDQLGLLDHLGIDRFLVMGFCIGGPFTWNLLQRAPNRVAAAAHRRGLEGTLSSYRETVKMALVHLDSPDQSERVVDAIRASAADTDEDIRDMQEDEAVTHRAIKLLGTKRNDAYEAAMAALRDDTRQWWADTLAEDPEELEEGEAPPTADGEGLRAFLQGKVLPWFAARAKELANRPLIRDQAFGEALDIHKLEQLSRYEVHLDRKLERMLSMLLRLKDLRPETIEV